MRRNESTKNNNDAEKAECTCLADTQLVALFGDTNANMHVVLSASSDTNMLLSMIKEHNVKMHHVLASNTTISTLHRLGMQNLSDYVSLGMDSLYLSYECLSSQMLQIFGRDSLVDRFLITPTDAVNLAGTEGCKVLCISTNELLNACAGDPTHAFVVLRALGCPSSTLECSNIDPITLINTGLRSQALVSLGLNLVTLTNECGLDASHARSLGFQVSLLHTRR